MKYTLIFPFVLLCILSYGQKTKKQTIKNEVPEYKEVFYVLLDSPDVKQGAYTRTYEGRYQIRISGEYSHGERAGTWTFSNFSGGIEQEIDFTHKKVISAKPVRSIVSSSIMKGDTMIENTSEHLPLFLGDKAVYRTIL